MSTTKVLSARVEEQGAEPELPQGVKPVLRVLDLASTLSKAKRIPSSIMLQVLLYGDTFKRVVMTVDVDYSEFERRYARLMEELSRQRGTIVEPVTKHTYYDRFWVDLKTVKPEDVAKVVEYLTEPLRATGVVEFRLRGEPKFNWKFSEAVETYVFQERIEGLFVVGPQHNCSEVILYARWSKALYHFLSPSRYPLSTLLRYPNEEHSVGSARNIIPIDTSRVHRE